MRSSLACLLVLCGCNTYRFYHDTPAPPDAITDTSTWIELAGSGSGDGLNQAGAADVAVDADAAGNPTVVWSDVNGDINVRQWSGSGWVDLAFPNSTGPSAEAHVRVGVSGSVVVAWTEGPPASGEIWVQRLVNGIWTDLGSASASPTQQSFEPRLALTRAGDPVVAWLELAGNYEVYAAHYDGSAWQPYTNLDVSNDPDVDWSPAVAVGPDDNPCVSWTSNAVIADLRLVCWSGVAWNERAGSLAAGSITPTASQAWDSTLAVDASGQPWIAWRGDTSGGWEAYLEHFNGTAWVALGGSPRVSPDPQSSDQAVMALDDSGAPVLAWKEDIGGGTAIHASTWNGTQWTGIADSLSAAGVSGVGNMVRPSIAASADGSIVLAWLAGNSDSPRIYVRRSK